MARLDLPGSKSSSCILKPKWQQALPGWVFSIMSFHDVYFETNAFSNFHKGLVCLFKFSPLCQGVSTSLKGRCRWFCRRSCFLKVYVYIIWTAITFPIKIENIYVASWFCCGLVWKFLLSLLYSIRFLGLLPFLLFPPFHSRGESKELDEDLAVSHINLPHLLYVYYPSIKLLKAL